MSLSANETIRVIVGNVETAQNTANSAKSAASTAQSTANAASTTASNAQSTATDAKSAADAAATVAGEAKSAADAAASTADEAKSAADTAMNDANTAGNKAAEAVEEIGKLPIYTDFTQGAVFVKDAMGVSTLKLNSGSVSIGTVTGAGAGYSQFTANYVQFGNYQLRKTADGGMAFKLA